MRTFLRYILIKIKYRYIFILFVLLPYLSIAQKTQTRSLHVGEIWQTDEDIPSGGWQIGFNWPGNHWSIYGANGREPEVILSNGSVRMGGLSCGLRNWKDEKGIFYPYVVYTVSGSVICHTDNKSAGKNLIMKTILRRRPPRVYVNNKLNPPRHEYDEIDPSLISDAKMTIRWATPIGITFQQDYYAYAQENADSYLFIDFHAVNNGKTGNDEEGSPTLNGQILHDVYFNYGIQPVISYEGACQNHNVIENKTDDWVEYYGENYKEYIGDGSPLEPKGNSKADSLRVFMVWDGDNPKTPYDDTGDPNSNNGVWISRRPPLGKFLSPQYFGMGILHADKSVHDKSNDLSQPVTATWHAATIPQHFWTTQLGYKYFFEGDGSVVGENWQHYRPSPQELGYTDPTDPNKVARPNPYITVGPYEMPFNSEIHWTILTAVNGISQQACAYYGKKWQQGQNGDPNGITDAQKNAILATGRDSLLKVFSRATRLYFSNIKNHRNPFDVPDPPQAPDLWVTSSERSIKLKWSDVSAIPDFDTGVKDFSGYRVYRAEEINDTTYQLIWECGGNSGVPVALKYEDRNVEKGVNYYYYVTAFDDGSQNWYQPGKSLESGKYWNMMQRYTPITLCSGPDTIEINYLSRESNESETRKQKLNILWPSDKSSIKFINLPDSCRINVYTLSGNLIVSLNANGQTDIDLWKVLKETNRLPANAVYLFQVKAKNNEMLGKIVIL